MTAPLPIRIGIIGATGYTAQELTALLAIDAAFTIVFLQSSSAAGEISAFVDRTFEALDIDAMIACEPHVVVFGTPHGIAMRDAPRFLEKDIRVVDLSGDFRFRDIKMFEKAYGIPHTQPDIPAAYGLPEYFADDIAAATLVANPGCYVTSALLATLPIAHLIDWAVYDAASGYSGAGKGYADLPRLQKNVVMPYGLARHRHAPEIAQFIDAPTYFTPHIIARFRGIENTVHLKLKNEISADDVFALFAERYRDCPYVRVQRETPELDDVAGKNHAVLGGFERDEHGRLIIVSMLDNLRKGAASQALQNLHAMFALAPDIPEPTTFLQPPTEN